MMAHIAILETFQKHKIPIDYLVGASSGAVVAVAFSAGTLGYFKNWMYTTSFRKMLKIWSRKNAVGGLFHLNGSAAQEVIDKFVNGLTFETANPQIGIVATDVDSGELVTISMGPMDQALRATVAVPGILEPVVWGGRVLVDGGLASIVPTKPLREMGADIVIGINISPAKFIFESDRPYWNTYHFVSQHMPWQLLVVYPLGLIRRFIYKFLLLEEYSAADNSKTTLNSFQVLTRAVDRSMEFLSKHNGLDDECDLMISPDVKQFKKKGEFKALDEIYAEGERTALAAIPKIRKLISQFESFDPARHDD